MTTSRNKEPLLTIAEAAEYLNVSKGTIRRWTNDGTLPCVRIGARKARRFFASELRKLVSGPAGERDRPVTEKAPAGTHQCVVCKDAGDEWQALANAVIRHLAQRSHVVFVGDTGRKTHLAAVLAEHGVDAEALVSSGALRFFSVEESYLLTGSFSPARAIAFVESVILDAFAKGFDRLLFVGFVDWVFSRNTPDDGSLLARVMQYETQLNEMLGRYPTVTILCPYVLSRIDSGTIVDAFLAHPQLLINAHVVDGLWTGQPGGNSTSGGR